jgi:hypothetical protein
MFAGSGMKGGAASRNVVKVYSDSDISFSIVVVLLLRRPA